MALYYDGDLDKDLQNINMLPYTAAIRLFTDWIAYGRLQQLAKERSTWGRGDEGPDGRFLPDILALSDAIGLCEFCRVVQILWAKAARDEHNLPLSGALDLSDPASLG